MFKLNNLKAPFGSNSAPKRKGRGIGSGNGKTAGRGHKGQRARSGAPIPQVFEGGQMQLSRRSPKMGFRSHLKKLDVRLGINELGQAELAGKAVQIQDLLPKTSQGQVRSTLTLIGAKLTVETLPKSVEAHRITPSALAILKSKGVEVKLIEKTRRFDSGKAKSSK